MKKLCLGATFLLCLSACYTPLNNSGVATTKQWLEVSGKKMDFEGKQYDSCYRFNLRFWPQEAASALDLQETCISACCWRGDKSTVTLDFNRNFEEDLARYGRAYKYTPEKITLTVSHSNLLNTTKASSSPKGAVSMDGLVKLKYKLVENPARQAQLDVEARERAARAAQLAKNPPQTAAVRQEEQNLQAGAKGALLRQKGEKIDRYFYNMNKAYKSKGQVFLLSGRLLTPRATGTPKEYTVSCRAHIQKGPSAATLTKSTVSCGTWLVNLNTLSVLAQDARAQEIQNN